MKNLAYFWNELKSTFWFIPILIILTTIILAFTLLYLDSQIQISPYIWQYFFISSAASARSILAIIAGAMIGVAGTVFSIILVVLTLTSSQFGSRLIRNFMYDRLNQVVLGSYVSTFIYCLIVLNVIKDNEQMVFIPSFSILLALFTTLINLILLITFIHHVATDIQAGNVISDIGSSLFKNIGTLFPETTEDERDKEKGLNENTTKSKFKGKQALCANKNGYLRYVNTDMLINLLAEMDVLLELHFRPGAYLVNGVKLGTIYVNRTLDKEKIIKLQMQFIVGKTRSQQQDAEYSIHQMVEIAVRALSPGINDPYTAISCIDNLASAMCHLAKVAFPSKYHYDEKEKLRFISNPLNYEGMLNAAFNQIRQFAKETPSVIIRLMEALITINNFTENSKHKKAIKKHAEMVLNLAEKSFTEPNDLRDLQRRGKGILDIKINSEESLTA